MEIDLKVLEINFNYSTLNKNKAIDNGLHFLKKKRRRRKERKKKGYFDILVKRLKHIHRININLQNVIARKSSPLFYV